MLDWTRNIKNTPKSDRLLAYEIDRARTLNEHSTVKGDYLEETVRSFLTRSLSMNHEVVSGETIDSSSVRSRQCDVIIRPRWHPRYPKTLTIHDTCLGVGEVKSNLTKDEFRDSLEKARHFRKLIHEPLSIGNAEPYASDAKPPFFIIGYEGPKTERTAYNWCLEAEQEPDGCPIMMILTLKPRRLLLNTDETTFDVSSPGQAASRFSIWSGGLTIAHFIGFLEASFPTLQTRKSLLAHYLHRP